MWYFIVFAAGFLVCAYLTVPKFKSALGKILGGVNRQLDKNKEWAERKEREARESREPSTPDRGTPQTRDNDTSPNNDSYTRPPRPR